MSSPAPQGTKGLDVYPQIFHMDVTQTTINTFKEASFSTPVVRTPSVKGKALVMEILKIFVEMPSPPTTNATEQWRVVALSRKTATSVDSMSKDNLFCHYHGWINVAASGGFQAVHNEMVYDFTAPNGKGILFAGSTLYLQAMSVNYPAATYVSVKVRILYRLVEVETSELVGLLTE
jgi:hypothetical protein